LFFGEDEYQDKKKTSERSEGHPVTQNSWNFHFVKTWEAKKIQVHLLKWTKWRSAGIHSAHAIHPSGSQIIHQIMETKWKFH
jgi:hypothetical protein